MMELLGLIFWFQKTLTIMTWLGPIVWLFPGGVKFLKPLSYVPVNTVLVVAPNVIVMLVSCLLGGSSQEAEKAVSVTFELPIFLI